MIRLTLPKRFRSEQLAGVEIRAWALWTLGGHIVPEGRYFRVVIDTARPEAVQRYLKQQMGDRWQQETVAP